VASRGRKIRAGLFAIAAAALAVFAVLAFGGMRVLRGGDPYHVVFEGTVYGLEDGANVYMNGVRVGAVDTIEVSPDHPGQVRVRIVVASGTPVRTDTRAMLQFTGITGLKVIDLRGGTPTAAALPPGSTIPAGETTFDRLERRAAELADQSVALVERANAILDHVVQLTQPDGKLVESATRAADELAAAGAALRAIVTENRAAIRRSIASIDRAARSAEETAEQLQGVVRTNSAVVRAMLFDLRQASRTLKELAREVRQRPSRLLFSRPLPERKLP
jgi:phospholipid/cholesterol/gamma-HCH transport system substrate-binding protein